ncbi:MAG TPA: hypothetical protein VJR89_43940 [Polyangiales bacterium]|nr:hypothetical protein [Polyangiales bacterium]
MGAVSCGDDEPAEDAGTDGSTSEAVCGNGKREGKELCDKTDLDGETCKTVGDGMYTGGTLSCTSTCTFNVSKCTGGDSGADMDGGGGGAGG